MHDKPRRGLATVAIHGGQHGPHPAGAVVLPVFQSSTFLYAGQTSYHDVPYIRLNNTPNHRALGDTIAALEDMCWHRLLPLSMGWLEGDEVVCRYHGLAFDGKG